MIFCEKCFKDQELKLIISSLAGKTVGKCPVCHSNAVHLYDTDIQSDLTPLFENLIQIYASASALPTFFPRAEYRMLIDELSERWNIFGDISRLDKSRILQAICSELYEESPEIFDGPVGIPELYEAAYLREHALLRNNNWDEFVNEIKTINRYHSKLINLEILEKYCSFIRKTFKEGDLFFRARISEREGYPVDRMSAPPPGKSSEGRANARGITCLYLAGDLDTTLHEVRAGVFDFVSVGQFRLKKDIVVVDLRAIAHISPFVEGLGCLDHAINIPYLEKINAEMSKPLRRSDSTLDYVPTQYIVDFVKSLEHDGEQEYAGIIYNSTTNPGGYNLAAFTPELFECVSVDVYDIKKLQYDKDKL